MKTTLLYMFVFLTTSLSAMSDTLSVQSWLVSQPQIVKKPIFSDTKNTQNETFKNADLLKYDNFDIQSITPKENELFNQTGVWSVKILTDNTLNIVNSDTSEIGVNYVGTYIWVERWMKLKLEIKSPQMMRAWLDDSEIGTKQTTESSIEKQGKISKELKLERGKHKLMIKTLHFPSDSCQWSISASVIIDSTIAPENIRVETDPTDRKNISHIMHGTRCSGVKLSPDAKYYSISYRITKPGGENPESWTEIKRTNDDNLIFSFQHSRISQLQWLPKSNRLSYIVSVGKDKHMYVFDVEKLTSERLFVETNDMGWCTWSPDESYVTYNITEKDDFTYKTTKRVDGMGDRLSGYRDRSFIHKFDIKTLSKERLTFGNQSTYVSDISPDSRYLAVSTSYRDYTERPFSKQQVYIIDLNTLTTDTLWTDKRWSVSISFSPDGKKLLCAGGPSAFGEIGENIGEYKIANNYDTQLYIYDIETKTVDPITKDFNPSVDNAIWSSADNNIYISTTDKDSKRIYKYEVKKNKFVPITQKNEYVTGLDMASKATVISYKSSKTNLYGSYRILDLKSNKLKIVEELEKQNYKNVELGEVRDWNFVSSQGVEISGRYYLPVGFDTTKKYPVIVYYYGGTSPVGRTFGGRYPFNLWAGAGYIVYVLQPSGATGFGQEFSAAHVNNWGITVADEIIEGTKKFLAEHSFADEKHVGCIGASYGGFMTMLLTTRTDIFAAAISHAGISSISSYWGVGYWGYAYSAEATADSYPWNAKDLYVNQSPLFNADKVTTPLLLLTGDSDTNVPPGESIQLYTALKILGKEVELVTVKNEDHHIFGYKNRIEWHNTIMAWWDKYLKNQEEWWNELYPTKNY